MIKLALKSPRHVVAASILSDDFDDESDSDAEVGGGGGGGAKGGGRKKTGLPKQSTAILKAWLFQHLMVREKPCYIVLPSTHFRS